MRNYYAIEPKWIASLYALSAVAVCTLIFTYNGTDFINALIKTFFSAVAFYLLGIVTSSLINFIAAFADSAKSKEKEQKTDSA